MLDRCVRPDLDVRLPTVRSEDGGAQFFVLAFADNRGAGILTRRLGEQLDRRKDERPPGLTTSVSYRMLPPFLQDSSLGRQEILAAMVATLEASMQEPAADAVTPRHPAGDASDSRRDAAAG